MVGVHTLTKLYSLINRVTFTKVLCTGKVSTHGKMVWSMKESSAIVKLLVWESTLGRMAGEGNSLVRIEHARYLLQCLC